MNYLVTMRSGQCYVVQGDECWRDSGGALYIGKREDEGLGTIGKAVAVFDAGTWSHCVPAKGHETA